MWAALAVVYVVWGSTYLAIDLAVETLPSFLMLAVCFFIAGAVLYLISSRGAERPRLVHWRSALAVGGRSCSSATVASPMRFSTSTRGS